MLVKMRPTTELVTINGVPCRRWAGFTDRGGVVDVFVVAIQPRCPQARKDVEAHGFRVPAAAVTADLANPSDN